MFLCVFPSYPGLTSLTHLYNVYFYLLEQVATVLVESDVKIINHTLKTGNASSDINGAFLLEIR